MNESRRRKIQVLQRMIAFYRLHLARFWVFRLMRASIAVFYRASYRAYCRLTPDGHVKRFHMIAFGDYAGDHLTTRLQVFPAQRIHIPAPRLIQAHSIGTNAEPQTISIDMPKIDVLELSNAVVMGGADFIMADDAALAPDRFLEFSDTCPADLFGVTASRHVTKTLQVFTSRPEIKIEAAVSLLGQNTTNYAHWLTETLPKLSLLNGFSQYNHLPLLVDRNLHANIYDSLLLLGGRQQPIIRVDRWQCMRVRKLICVSQAGYEPYIPQDLWNIDMPRLVNSFSAPALTALRNAVLRALPPMTSQYGEKIFLCRNGDRHNQRGLANAKEIEALMKKKGYALIDPAKLSFAEQVHVCRAARSIIAPVGAGLVNFIFASEQCRIIALAPYYKNANYYFYANFAAALRRNFCYLVGQHHTQYGHPSHRCYHISLMLLEQALDAL